MSEFTTEIPVKKREGTPFEHMQNHDEQKAQADKTVSCHDCRFFLLGCDEYVGRWHKTCGEFQWW